MINSSLYKWSHKWSLDVSIAPLITFRFLFYGLCAYSALRFMSSGWIESCFEEPTFFFKYYGFEWVNVPSVDTIYLLYKAILVSALFCAVGFLYRLCSVVFFFTFTWAQLLDASNYLNHYYLVVLIAFLLIFFPLNAAFSLDVKLNLAKKRNRVPSYFAKILQLQLGIVYFFAGLAKLNYDWLVRAMPLTIWLPNKIDTPLIGPFLKWPISAKLFSVGGAIYDLTIAFFLSFKKTRPIAYIAVLGFHISVGLLFNIGLFPQIMIFCTLIFFSPQWHEKLWSFFGVHFDGEEEQIKSFAFRKILLWGVGVYFLIQVFLPLRHLLYSGDVLWNEEGYRFSWRVMLVEKGAYATFRLVDPVSGRKGQIVNSDHLTIFQEKQMMIQPDFILQFAHFLDDYYSKEYGVDDLEVYCDCFVYMNRKPSQPFLDPTVDLSEITDNWKKKYWINAYKN